MKLMDTTELKSYIDSLESRLEKEIYRLHTAISGFSSEITRLERVQQNCPVVKPLVQRIETVESKIARVATIGKWNIAMMSVFLASLLFIFKITLSDGKKPNDVYNLLESKVVRRLDKIESRLESLLITNHYENNNNANKNNNNQ